MRTVSPELKAHLAQECTTIATCWQITRRDGVTFYFTDHDQPITFAGNIHVSTAGYNRTAISGTSGFRTDELDLSGFFATGSLVEDDMRNGLFDFAEVLIFVVNYENIGQGRMILRRGNLGEVQLLPTGAFRVEMRGLTQRLAQNVGEKYQAECRADVGDRRCKIPINPPAIQRGVTYLRGQWLRVPIADAGALRYPIPVTNAGFESGLSGWTTVSGNPAVKTSNGPFGPYEGTRFLEGGSPSLTFSIAQIVNLTTAVDFDPVSVDAGAVTFAGSVRRATTADDQSDAGRFFVQALDENNLVLGTLWDTGYEVIPDDAGWALRATADAVLPVGTRKVRVWCEGSQNTGAIVNAAFDDIKLELVDSEGLAGVYEKYGNRLFEVRTGGITATTQPPYDSTVGGQTTDGTVVLRAYQAWSRHAVVDTVAGNDIFTVVIDEPRAVDDWFNGGAVIWESGANAGLVMEVKDWIASTSQIALFLPMPNAISSGDRLRVYPGCDKRLATCISKFNMGGTIDFNGGNHLNFRGEPYLPGRDQLARYPDAK